MWTEESELHIARHKITPTEVEDVIYSRPRWVDAGRDFVVTARDMTATEKRTFREKGR